MELWKYQLSFLKWRQSLGSYSLGSLVTTLACEDPVQCRLVIIKNTLNAPATSLCPGLSVPSSTPPPRRVPAVGWHPDLDFPHSLASPRCSPHY